MKKTPRSQSMQSGYSGATVSWPRIKQILHDLLVSWQNANGQPPDLRAAHGDKFIDEHPFLGWETKAELQRAVAYIAQDQKSFPLIQPGVAGKDTNLIQALTVGVDKGDGTRYPRMPLDGPYLDSASVDEIVRWIDAGMPD